jgi:predicted RNA binding protein YcfA (HicA-like mRNA interferase family)
MLKNIKPKDLIKVLIKLGFEEIHVTGSHHRLIHLDGRKTTVPIHGSEPIGVGLLSKIIKKDVGISKEEFEKLLSELLLF